MPNDSVRTVLEFWFSATRLDAPQIDSRMERWFGGDPSLDTQIREEFGEVVRKALSGRLEKWADDAESRLALIIVLDQFCRNMYRGTSNAFAGDRRALKLCVEGAIRGDYKNLTAIERVFFFMPLQHSESLNVQDKSVRIFNALAEGVSGTLRETFMTFAQFAELHRDIVARFGRFPHRNRHLGRRNTAEEDQFLAAEGVSFGQ